MGGPPLNGRFGKQIKLRDGQTVTVDEAYLRESILQPDAKIVQGYSRGTMSSVVSRQMGRINEGDNLAALVEYIKSLK